MGLDTLFCGLHVRFFAHFFQLLILAVCKIFLYSIEVNPLSFVLEIFVHIFLSVDFVILPLPYKSSYALNSKYTIFAFFTFIICIFYLHRSIVDMQCYINFSCTVWFTKVCSHHVCWYTPVTVPLTAFPLLCLFFPWFTHSVTGGPYLLLPFAILLNTLPSPLWEPSAYSLYL